MFTILIYTIEPLLIVFAGIKDIMPASVLTSSLFEEKQNVLSPWEPFTFLSCSCTNAHTALAYIHTQSDITVVNTHFLIKQLPATVGPKGHLSCPSNCPHYQPNHHHLLPKGAISIYHVYLNSFNPWH